MDMTAHNAICTYFKPLIFLAIPDTIQKNILVFPPDKHIQPIDNGKGYKVQSALITDLVFPAHRSF
jgi:hypothetical protein